MLKEVVWYLMQVMVFQSFVFKVMFLDCVGCLVVVIYNFEGYLSGKSIVMSWIQLYKRLVKQCFYYMVVYISWFQDFFIDMLSLMKDIWIEVIGLGIEVGF